MLVSLQEEIWFDSATNGLLEFYLISSGLPRFDSQAMVDKSCQTWRSNHSKPPGYGLIFLPGILLHDGTIPVHRPLDPHVLLATVGTMVYPGLHWYCTTRPHGAALGGSGFL